MRIQAFVSSSSSSFVKLEPRALRFGAFEEAGFGVDGGVGTGVACGVTWGVLLAEFNIVVVVGACCILTMTLLLQVVTQYATDRSSALEALMLPYLFLPRNSTPFPPIRVTIVVGACTFLMPDLATNLSFLMPTFGASQNNPHKKVPLGITLTTHLHKIKFVSIFLYRCACSYLDLMSDIGHCLLEDKCPIERGPE